MLANRDCRGRRKERRKENAVRDRERKMKKGYLIFEDETDR